MDEINLLAVVADAGVSVVLLVVLWQGLKRFDQLLTVVINLAMLNSDKDDLRQQAERNLHDTITGR